MIVRTIQQHIESKMFKGKVIIVYGARQTGKTTLITMLKSRYPGKSVYLNCDEPDIRDAFSGKTSTEIKEYIGNTTLVLLDEAQRLENAGLTLKLIVDTYPEIQVIATGSSSFELSSSIVEPLTGRKYEFLLHPFSLAELYAGQSSIEIKRLLDTRMIYGMYPEVTLAGEERAGVLSTIARSYLYKDILAFQNIRNASALERLLQALALQIGSEVSYTELAQTVGLDKKTVESYVDILEKAFIVFRLGPFSRNLRNELKKKRKIYFYDTGIRNAIIRNFNPPEIRNDKGAIWENFLIAERVKQNANTGYQPNIYFWRDHQKREIDYIEEEGGRLQGYEIKYARSKISIPQIFLETYPGSSIEIISRDNCLDFMQADAYS